MIVLGTKVSEKDSAVDYQFVTKCPKCSKGFAFIWVMDPIRVGPGSVARIKCPTCSEKFYRTVKDLLPYTARGQLLVAGRPVRSVEIAYDCSFCGNHEISVSILHTDLSWEELSEETGLEAVCNKALCPQRGLPQVPRPARVRVGALVPDQ
jgi:hypothetical protein